MLPREGRSTPKRRLDYRPPDFLVDEVALEFDLDPESTLVTATYAFRRNPASDRLAPLVLDGEHQDEVRLWLDERPVSASRVTRTPSALALRDPPRSGTLRVQSRCVPSRNASLEGLYVSAGVFCTQCEPEGFRRITYVPDRPDVLARYTVTLRADRKRYPVLLSNGNLLRQGRLPQGRHFAVWHDPFPKPTYLFALVAGDIAALEDTFTTRSGRSIALSIHSTPSNLPRCRHAMESLKRAMAWDEQRFGREYDLDRFMIFCADDFNMGAMENKGLNIFNSRLVLADPQVATDADYASIEGVIGHEYFHNWSGNRVTCRDWFQLSLKEGLTVFRDQEFSGDMGSHAVERIGAVDYLRREQFAEDAGPMAHPVRPDEYQEINNFYTSTVYEKGAEVIRMQHTLLGAERFRAGTDLYFARHDGQAVTCDDFVQAMQDASGIDLRHFRRWYAQAGTPKVRATGHYDPGAKTYTLDLAQQTDPTPGQPVKQPFHIPVAVGLLDPSGRELALRLAGEAAAGPTTRVLDLRESEQRFVFVDVPARPVASLLRGFSAPVQLEFEHSDADVAFLAAHDSDAVNRWDAAQRCHTQAILRIANGLRRGQSPGLPDTLADMVGHMLEDRSSDPALLALALKLPDPAYVAALEQDLDVDGITSAWLYVQRELARRHRAAFEDVHASSQVREPYAPEQAQIGARSLANICLRYLGSLDDARAHTLALQQHERADNMTNAVAALLALKDSRAPAREDLYARFEARWRDEPLVLDKWFAMQARSWAEGTAGRVRELLHHPRFNARNPNRVRSLVGAFTLGNFARFHAVDGSGYDFAVEQVVALDGTNPQLASAVASSFNLWKRFPEPRRSLMHRALLRIAATPRLSPDVNEIVTRTLE